LSTDPGIYTTTRYSTCSALDKLVGAGKLRISTVLSQYRDKKSEKLISADDVLELK
jgi:hypothetical protein